MAIARATRRALTSTRSAVSIRLSMHLLFFIITLTTVSKPATVKAHHNPSRPSTLVIYQHEDQISPNRTVLIVASPSGVLNGSVEFGSIGVFDNPLREGTAGDSPVLGAAKGQATVINPEDATFYLAYANVLNTPSYTGSITVEGVITELTYGELAITGGTGDFRGARGYVEHTQLSNENRQDVVYNTTFHIKYD